MLLLMINIYKHLLYAKYCANKPFHILCYLILTTILFSVKLVHIFWQAKHYSGWSRAIILAVKHCFFTDNHMRKAVMWFRAEFSN